MFACTHEIIINFVKENDSIQKLELIDTNPGGSEIVLKEILLEDIMLTFNHQIQKISYMPHNPIQIKDKHNIVLTGIDTTLKFYIDPTIFFEVNIYSLGGYQEVISP